MVLCEGREWQINELCVVLRDFVFGDLVFELGFLMKPKVEVIWRKVMACLLGE
jgi:hypothetical protein